MSDDLLKRLRESRTMWENARGVPSDLEREAADTIAALTAENGILRTEKHADAEGIAALTARVAELEGELRQAERSRDEWKSDYAALSQAVVGDTGLSAMLVATQARLYRPRAERAEAALATAEMDCRSYKAMAADAIHRMDARIAENAALSKAPALTADVQALVDAGNAMADSIKGSYIRPGSATAWYAALAAMKGDTA